MSKPSSLRFSRPRGEANEKKQFSEAIFRFNVHSPTRLTPFFLVGIFLRLAKSVAKVMFFSHFCSFSVTFASNG